MIRKRRTEGDGEFEKIKSIYTESLSDKITSKPYIIRMQECMDGVIKEARYDLFDAFTGSPMVTETKTVDRNNVAHKKLNVQVGHRFFVPALTLDTLYNKNMFTLPGLTLTAESKRAETWPYIPQTVNEILNTSDNSIVIKSASIAGYDKELYHTVLPEIIEGSTTYPAVTIDQSRYFKKGEWMWKGEGSFATPETAQNKWIMPHIVNAMDRFGRPYAMVDAQGLHSTITYHPVRGTMAGIADNADFKEFAVFTCEYDDYYPTKKQVGDEIEFVDDPYFDVTYGWERNQTSNSTTDGECKLVSDVTHFGQRSVYVKNAYGPTINRRIYKGKTYKFSAWVRVNTGIVYMVVERRKGLSTITENEWPILGTAKLGDVYGTNISKTITVTSGWKYIEVEVPTIDLGNGDWYARMWIGNPDSDAEVYMDDLRFYPKGALVSTFYYDLNLGVPVSFVNANNNALYSKYDPFGRAIENGVVKVGQ